MAVILKDWFRYRRLLMGDDKQYLGLCNRYEKLEISDDGSGYRCLWKWTSDLHAPQYLPYLGKWLMRRALEDHPVVRAVSPIGQGAKPEISFIIGHRGLDRLPHLLSTLEGIAGQNVAVECIVVEQDVESRIADKLPAWVRHILTRPPVANMPYCRSWTFNVGAKFAMADIIVLHDNDMLVPADYAACIIEKIRDDYEVVNLKRYIFYLNKSHTAKVFVDKNALLYEAPQSIMQNSEGGGSIAITKKAYESIGGFDEGFIGWGGEDSEFWERAQTLRVWSYANLPILHLWHEPQLEKNIKDAAGKKRFIELHKKPVQERIKLLRARMIKVEENALGIHGVDIGRNFHD